VAAAVDCVFGRVDGEDAEVPRTADMSVATGEDEVTAERMRIETALRMWTLGKWGISAFGGRVEDLEELESVH
jgi:hypothetical protein